MNIALVIAGGSGARMKQDIPKQFLNVHDKPIIIYTLEAFQKHPEIDGIVVVCIDGWHDTLRAYCKQFGITKLENIVSGGENGQASIRNGVYDIQSRHYNGDVVLVHDAIRPMVSEAIISDNIRVCAEHGNAITAISCAEAMLVTVDGVYSEAQVPRNNLKRTQTPQTVTLGNLVWAHEEALRQGITDSVATCTLFIELKQKLHFAMGSEKNIKLTTPEDIELFKSLLTTKQAIWMK